MLGDVEPHALDPAPHRHRVTRDLLGRLPATVTRALLDRTDQLLALRVDLVVDPVPVVKHALTLRQPLLKLLDPLLVRCRPEHVRVAVRAVEALAVVAPPLVKRRCQAELNRTLGTVHSYLAHVNPLSYCFDRIAIRLKSA